MMSKHDHKSSHIKVEDQNKHIEKKKLENSHKTSTKQCSLEHRMRETGIKHGRKKVRDMKHIRYT